MSKILGIPPAAPAKAEPAAPTILEMQGDLLLVSEVKPPQYTAGGLVLPDKARLFKYKTATVISVGPGSMTQQGVRAAMPFQPGDRILFNNDAGLTLQHGGQTFLVLGEGDIIATERPVVG